MKDFGVQLQFCLAHLIRDVKFLTTLPDRITRNYGERVLDGLRQLFKIIHRRETMTESGFAKAIERARNDLVATAKRAPRRTEAQNLAERFRLHGQAYFQFITTPHPWHPKREGPPMVRTHLDRAGYLCHTQAFSFPIPPARRPRPLQQSTDPLAAARRAVNVYHFSLNFAFSASPPSKGSNDPWSFLLLPPPPLHTLTNKSR